MAGGAVTRWTRTDYLAEIDQASSTLAVLKIIARLLVLVVFDKG